MYQTLKQDRDGLFFEGTAAQAQRMHAGEFDQGFGFELNDHSVEVSSNDAKHNGKDAVRFELTAGRVILLPDTLVSWTITCESAEIAEQFATRLRNQKIRPPFMQIELDFAFDDQALDQALMDMHDEFGVVPSIIHEHGPSGGWPVVEFSGKTENLERFLRVAYDMDDNEIIEQLG